MSLCGICAVGRSNRVAGCTPPHIMHGFSLDLVGNGPSSLNRRLCSAFYGPELELSRNGVGPGNPSPNLVRNQDPPNPELNMEKMVINKYPAFIIENDPNSLRI